jgi:peptidoglycan-associated lipoprotein
MRATAVLLAGSAALAISCGSDRRAQPFSAVGASHLQDVPSPRSAGAPAGDDPDQSNVAISGDIKTACGIADSDALFAYNSARMQDRDRAILKQLADCFTTGPLKGRTIELVGPADPRGEFEYDYLLGQWRADNIKVALINAGASSGQIATSARGDDRASATDAMSRALDRRVDVRLAK